MPDSSISVDVRRAVLNGFAGRLAYLLDYNPEAAELEATVTYGYDFGPPVTARVYSGRSRGESTPMIRAGRSARNETGWFDVNILVQMLGGDAEEADMRCAAIGSELESWLADRKSNQLDVDGLNSLHVESWLADYTAVDGGMASVRTYTIRYTARLE